MKDLSKQSNPDVFELILNRSASEPQMVRAEPTDFLVPENWHEEHQEGQLAIDVAQTDNEVIVVSTMAGAITGKLEVYVHNDLLTIRGERKNPAKQTEDLDYFVEECYWGKFSRTVVLPVHVKGDLAKAEYKNGVLTIRIPKQKADAKVPVVVVDE